MVTIEEQCDITDAFGIDAFNIKVNSDKVCSELLETLKSLHEPIEEAIFETDNPEIIIIERLNCSLVSKFEISKQYGDSSFTLDPEFLLFPDKDEVTLTARLKKFRTSYCFYKEKVSKDAQTRPNLFGDISHVWEYLDTYINGTNRRTVCLFNETDLIEEKDIEEYKSKFKIDPITYKFTIKRTPYGAKILVEYDIKDQ